MRARRRPRLDGLIPMLLSSSLACGSSSTEADSGATDDLARVSEDGGAGTAVIVEVGTGVEGFVPLVEGQEVPLNAGPQGGGRFDGYHVWAAARTRGLNPQGATLELSILDGDTRAVHATQTRVYTLEPSGGAFIAYGVAARLDDCCAVAGRAVIMRAAVSDVAGLSGSDERRVMVAPICPPTTGVGTPVCP